MQGQTQMKKDTTSLWARQRGCVRKVMFASWSNTWTVAQWSKYLKGRGMESQQKNVQFRYGDNIRKGFPQAFVHTVHSTSACGKPFTMCRVVKIAYSQLPSSYFRTRCINNVLRITVHNVELQRAALPTT